MTEEYPCFTVSQMAQIPEDILPDFLAELPDLLRHARQIETSANELGAELKAVAPWPWRLLPVSLFAATVKSGINRATFKNDNLGTITLNARISEKHSEFYSRTENLAAASADTRPEGGDATEIAAPFTSGAVGATSAETPNPSHRSTGE